MPVNSQLDRVELRHPNVCPDQPNCIVLIPLRVLPLKFCCTALLLSHGSPLPHRKAVSFKSVSSYLQNLLSMAASPSVVSSRDEQDLTLDPGQRRDSCGLPDLRTPFTSGGFQVGPAWVRPFLNLAVGGPAHHHPSRGQRETWYTLG